MNEVSLHLTRQQLRGAPYWSYQNSGSGEAMPGQAQLIQEKTHRRNSRGDRKIVGTSNS